MKRILLLATVVALMTVMLAVGAAPAFAGKPFFSHYHCEDPGVTTYTFATKKQANQFERQNPQVTCTKEVHYF